MPCWSVPSVARCCPVANRECFIAAQWGGKRGKLYYFSVAYSCGFVGRAYRPFVGVMPLSPIASRHQTRILVSALFGWLWSSASVRRVRSTFVFLALKCVHICLQKNKGKKRYTSGVNWEGRTTPRKSEKKTCHSCQSVFRWDMYLKLSTADNSVPAGAGDSSKVDRNGRVDRNV